MNKPPPVFEDRDAAFAFLRKCFALGRPFLLESDLKQAFQQCCEERDGTIARQTPMAGWVSQLQEGVFVAPWAYFSMRQGIAGWQYIRVHLEQVSPDAISASEFLAFKERVVAPDAEDDPLIIDFAPFNRDIPRLKEARSIGQGGLFLNRKLASELFQRAEQAETRLLHFLSVHAIEGQPLMVAEPVTDPAQFRQSLREALETVNALPPETAWSEFSASLHRLGFAPGWGDHAAQVVETLNLLLDLLEAPSPSALESFIARIPMVSKILIVTPHGYFGQDDVLGLPDTGGQVVYILDQVRALEKEMHARLRSQGVAVEPKILVLTRQIPQAGNTTCNQRMEKISGCDHSWILRVPFREADGQVVPHWISRFELWPYVERFARDAEKEAVSEFHGRPDLIIGNYSDGSLVASLLSERLGVTQCNIAHALEKTKYLLSDLYWKDNDADYHFSCQYTADLIAMNSADFIVTSTYQEIAGTVSSVGQYESYGSFSMPGLYRVTRGIDVFDPKFNIVSPGANPDIYFPFTERERRLISLHADLEDLVMGPSSGDARGALLQRDKPMLFSMARLDRIKNLTGLVEWFGANDRLREMANLVIVGGMVDPAASDDAEEREQIARMHALFDHYQLDAQVRWVGQRLDKNMAGELYRWIADRRGIFVQPALFEAFGLTLIEAMASGLPVFATRYGGPLEIIEDGVSGFHIDPNDGHASAARMVEFLKQCARDPEIWERISKGGLDRVQSRYTWHRYAERMMTLTRIYGFWKFLRGLEREEARQYLHTLYHLQFRPLARAMKPA